MSSHPGPHVAERVGQFFIGDDRLEYTEFGSAGRGGDRWVVLVHGQLMPRSMHDPLARVLAAHGNHVVTVDLLGHGRSDRPEDPRDYSMTAFAEQVVALLDHLGAETAVVGVTSLGANVGLEVAVLAPDRVQGLLLEMPVLDNAVEAGILAFAPLLFTARFAPFVITLVAASSRLVPRRFATHWGRVVLDTLDQRPGPMAAAVHGLFFGRIAPPARTRRTLPHPALVVGHPGDPIHLAADARMVADELARASYVEASSILEWRLRPQRLTARTVDFVDEVWGRGTAQPGDTHLEEVGGAVLP
jgi:pimeloyl-ACP methyl ester carboxylesterase